MVVTLFLLLLVLKLEPAIFLNAWEDVVPHDQDIIESELSAEEASELLKQNQLRLDLEMLQVFEDLFIYFFQVQVKYFIRSFGQSCLLLLLSMLLQQFNLPLSGGLAHLWWWVVVASPTAWCVYLLNQVLLNLFIDSIS